LRLKEFKFAVGLMIKERSLVSD